MPADNRLAGKVDKVASKLVEKGHLNPVRVWQLMLDHEVGNEASKQLSN